MIGWLVDTNVIASLIAPNGAPSVKGWGRAVDERRLFNSILTLAEYDKGIANLAGDDPNVPRYIAAEMRLRPVSPLEYCRSATPSSVAGGAISGRVKRETGHPPPVIDALLAATAIEADLYLVSRNTKNLQHCGAAVFDPWRDDIAAFPLKPPRRR